MKPSVSSISKSSAAARKARPGVVWRSARWQRQRRNREQCHPEIGGQHDKLAMRDVDNAHDAEGKREAETEQPVEPAYHQPVYDGLDHQP